ncbi:LOW QUALITY PROTEIN: olfactory receptor 5AS1-like [Ciconia maguari]
MPEENCTAPTRFILLGFTNRVEVEISLFGLFLLIHATTLEVNAGLVVLVQLNDCLHMPMHYFLSNLSFLDLSCSSAIAPKMLVNLLAQQKTISLIGYATQMFLLAFADAKCLILAAMVYDRYVAICHPLLDTVAMSHRVCTSVVAGAYLIGGLTLLVHTSFMFTLSFWGTNMINHFFCDVPPLMELSCSDTHISEVLLFTLCGFIQTSTFLTIVLSYACILSTILRIEVAGSRYKAFYTCTSHLTAVRLFYGSLFFTYLQPSSSYSLGKVISAFYTVVFPVLNPLLYSLRNKLVKAALRRTEECFLSYFLRSEKAIMCFWCNTQ